MKKILILIVALVLCLSCLSACQDNPPVYDDETLENETKDPNRPLTDAELRAQEKDRLPDWVSEKFKGRSITTYSFVENYVVDTEGYGEYTGDKVSDLIYERNIAVEERLGIVIENKVSSTSSWSEYGKELNVFGNSQNNEFDIIYTMGNSAISSGVEYIYFSDVSQYEYLSLEDPWWKLAAMENLSFDGKALHYLVGDITLTTYTKASAIYVNAVEYAARYSDGLDGLYDLVIDGKWTLEVLAQKAAESYSDIDGNGLDLTTDFIGFAIGNPVRIKALEYGFDVRRWSRDDNGYVVVDFDLDRASTAVDAIIELLFENEGVYYDVGYVHAGDSFVNGNILFWEGQLKSLTQATVREMEEDFGIVPTPKLDEMQENYMSEIQESSTFVVIPTTCKDTEFASIVVEALCTESYRKVILPFLEECLKMQYVRESRAGQNIDIILNTAVKDYFGLNNPGGIGKLISTTALTEVNILISNHKSLLEKANNYDTIILLIRKQVFI